MDGVDQIVRQMFKLVVLPYGFERGLQGRLQ
jgi:hypothetical protein